RLIPDLDFISKFAHLLRLTRKDAADLMRLAGVMPVGITPERALQYLPVDFLQAEWSQRRQETVALAEAKAETIKVFNPLVVPGLLQTEQYARHVLRAAGVCGAKNLARAVESRLRRQRRLRRGQQDTTVMITEAAITSRLAPAKVLSEQ